MIVKQVRYAIQILEFFASRKRPATLSEIAEHFGWPRSSTFNLIETLSKSGLLYELRYRSGYYPTRRLLDLARTIVADGPLSERLRAMIFNLAERTGETAALAGLSGTSAVLLEVVESPSPIRYFAYVGERVPLYPTASGQAILSLLSPRERAALLRKLEYVRYTPNTPMSPEEVEAEIQNSVARGWFLNNNCYVPDLIGVAVPLPLPDRQLSLLVAGPAFRIHNRLAELVSVLRAEIDSYLADVSGAVLNESTSGGGTARPKKNFSHKVPVRRATSTPRRRADGDNACSKKRSK